MTKNRRQAPTPLWNALLEVVDKSLRRKKFKIRRRTLPSRSSQMESPPPDKYTWAVLTSNELDSFPLHTEYLEASEWFQLSFFIEPINLTYNDSDYRPNL